MVASTLIYFRFVRPQDKCKAGTSHEYIRPYSSVWYLLTALYINSLSRTFSQPVAGRRALYGYPCPEIPDHDSRGIYHNKDGMLYVK